MIDQKDTDAKEIFTISGNIDIFHVKNMPASVNRTHWVSKAMPSLLVAIFILTANAVQPLSPCLCLYLSSVLFLFLFYVLCSCKILSSLNTVYYSAVTFLFYFLLNIIPSQKEV